MMVAEDPGTSTFRRIIMVHHYLAAALASISPAYENLEALDERIAAVSEGAQPVDARLKLAVCPTKPIIAPPVNEAIVVRCEARGWRLRVPVKSAPQAVAAQILVRKGEMVECIDAGPGFSVSTSMIALEGGALGQAIRVKSLTSASAITATVAARGIVRF
jgi:flagellar basal body P-ring formation protein FlgA